MSQDNISIKKDIAVKKKKIHFFETYISKILKELSLKNGITSNSKQQLNSAICIIAKQISTTVIKLTEISKKKTISSKEVSNAVSIIFTGELALNAITEGNKSIINFSNKLSKGSSRQGKAGIVFPPSITEKFLRNFGYSKIMVTSTAPVFLAAVLEYLTIEILESSCKLANDNKRIRITIRDLQLSISNDEELFQLFKRLNLSFLGGGVLPYINPCLTIKKLRKKVAHDNDLNNMKKSHKFRPGTVALREIKKYQRMSNCLTIAKVPFERFVRSIVNKNKSMKISKEVFIILQYYIEQYIVNFLNDANNAAIHAGRVKLMSVDLEFICILRGILSDDLIQKHDDINEDNLDEDINDDTNEDINEDDEDDEDENDRKKTTSGVIDEPDDEDINEYTNEDDEDDRKKTASGVIDEPDDEDTNEDNEDNLEKDDDNDI